MIGLMILTSSCSTTSYYHRKLPIIPVPDRPSLSSDLDKSDFEAMIRYAKKLEVGIRSYNEYAEEENKKLEDQFEERNR
jgi:hypothetical protein